MKQNLLNKLWLRVCMIVAIMTTALSGTVWAEDVTDVLTATSFAATNTTYTDFTNVSFTSDAVYAGNSAKTSNGGIQLRSKNSNSGIVSTISGGKVKSVSITVESGSNTVDVYGSNTAYTAASDLYGNNKGTKLGSLSASGTVTVTDDYAYVGIRSNNGAIYLTNITIVWEVAGGSTPTVATPTFSPAAGTYTSAQSVTISSATEGATIYYTTDGTEPTTNSTQYNGAISVSSSTTIKAIATAAGYDNSSVATATYTIVSIGHEGTEADPYTVADARAAIDANTGVTEVYATGIVSAIPTAWSTTYNNITFNFVDNSGDEDFLQAFRCVSGTGVDASTVAVGDIVVVKGNLKKYNSTYEFDAACQLVSLTHPTAAVEAPIFSPEGGVYTTPQSVSFAVAAPTMEGYTFYYTLDGSEPTTQSTLYTGPIEVSTTTTIKAIAVKGGEVSLVTTATYAILAHAGTETDPYSVADAHAAIDANAGLTDVYATGVVTEIATAWNTEHSNISFNFVDAAGDGGSFLQAYRCVSTDAADASTVAVGDIVVVKGTLKLYGATYEFGAGCQLVSLTHSGTPADPVIVAENATIDAGVTYYELMYEIQNPVDGTELKASTTASWITSCTPSQKSFDRVMIECTANETTEDRTATIVLTYGTLTKEVTLTQKGIVAPITQFASLPFSFDGGNADIESTEGLTQDGLGADYNASPKLRFDGTGDYLLLAFDERPGVLTFDIKGNSFSGGTFKVMASEDGEEYGTVATYTELGATETKTITDLGEDIRYIKWVYTEKDAGNVALGNINLAKYSTETAIVAEDATIDADVTYYELIYEIQNPVDGTELSASTTASWITSCTPSQKSFDRVMIECTANETTEDRTATIVLTYGTLTKEVTLTQKGVVAPVDDYVTLPYSWAGGTSAELLAETGVTANGLGSDYGETHASYRVKLDGTGDYIQFKTNERPGVVTIGVKMIGGANTSTITVQESADGDTFTDVQVLTISGAQNDVLSLSTTTDFAETSRYVRLSFTKGSNVGVGPISIATYAPIVLSDYTLTVLNPDNVTITATYGTDGILTNAEEGEVTEGTEVTLALTVAEGYDLENVTVNGTADGQAVNLAPGTTETVFTFTMPAFGVTVNATAVEHVEVVTSDYVLATSITSGKSYVIVGENAGNYYVMGDQATNNRPAVAATMANGVLKVSDAYEFVIETASSENASGYSIFDPDAKGYLYAANSSKNYLMTQTDLDDNGIWAITIDPTDASFSVVAQGANSRNVMHFNPNNGNPIFSCYASTSSVTGPVYLYEKVESFVPTVQTVTVTDAGYATFVAEKNLEIPTDVQVKVFAVTVDGSYASLQPIVGNIPAGEAVLVKASAGDYNFLSAQTADPISGNNLVAATTDVVADGTQYVLANGASGIGFYQATSGSTIPAGKAYLVVTAAGVKPFYGFEDDATGIEMVNGQSSMVNDPIFKQGSTIVNLAGQRLQKMQRGINIIGGKKVLK